MAKVGLHYPVKNTFIDFTSAYIDSSFGDDDDLEFLSCAMPTFRQQSAPASFILRQMSATSDGTPKNNARGLLSCVPFCEEKESIPSSHHCGDQAPESSWLHHQEQDDRSSSDSRGKDEPETEPLDDDTGRRSSDNPITWTTSKKNQQDSYSLTHWAQSSGFGKLDESANLGNAGRSQAFRSTGETLAHPKPQQTVETVESSNPSMGAEAMNIQMRQLKLNMKEMKTSTTGGKIQSYDASADHFDVYRDADTAWQGKAMLSDWEGTTYTVMMRNIPNKLSQHTLRQEIENAGFEGCFDFLYVPIDPETHANKGYAFINFIEPRYAWIFRTVFENRKISSHHSSKVVSVVPAALQGFDANYAHYSSTQVNHKDSYMRPLFLRQPTQFPIKQGRRRRAGRGSLIDVAAKKQNALRIQNMVDEPIGGGIAQNSSKALKELNRQHAFDADVGKANDDTKSSVRFCPYCGAKVGGDYSFCSFCGESLDRLKMMPA